MNPEHLAAQARLAGETENGTASILLVDDEPANVKLLARVLSSAGYRNLVGVTDPRTVRDVCRDRDFDLVVLDLKMPHLDGFQVMRQLQDLGSALPPPILVVTAQHDREHMVRALRSGAHDYVTKPFEMDALLARVRNLLQVRFYQKDMSERNQWLEERVRERTGELLRSQHKIRELVAHHEKVREDERAHIAREIHDELGQYLTALRMDAALLKIRAGDGHSELSARVEAMKGLIDQTISVVRNVASSLRPAALDLGLVSAAEWLVSEFEARTGVECCLQVPETDPKLDEARSAVVFRILQESLTNITRHAAAGRVEVHVGLEEGRLTLDVMDDGLGFDPAEVREKKTYGLMGIRERAIMFGGDARIDSAPGRGTSLRVSIPLPREGA